MNYNILIDVVGISALYETLWVDSVEGAAGAGAALEQPDASVVTVNCLGVPFTGRDEQNLADLMYRRLLVKVTPDDTGIEQTVFVGEIVNITSAPFSADGATQIITFTGMGRLAQMANIPFGLGDLPAETEYQRVQRYEDYNSMVWAALPDTATWATIEDYGFGRTWQGFGSIKAPFFRPSDYPTIGTSYDLEARPAEPTNALQYFQELARRNSGWLSEDGAYTKYYSRLEIINQTYTPIDISGCAIGSSLQTNINFYDIYTAAIYSNSTVSRAQVVGDLVRNYGYRPLEMTTELANAAELEDLAEIKVQALSQPRAQLQELTIAYNFVNPDFRFFQTPKPIPVALTGVPAAFGGDAEYAIRGLRYRLKHNYCEADWILLPRQMIDPFTEWIDLNSTVTWDTWTPALQSWNEVI